MSLSVSLYLGSRPEVDVPAPPVAPSTHVITSLSSKSRRVMRTHHPCVSAHRGARSSIVGCGLEKFVSLYLESRMTVDVFVPPLLPSTHVMSVRSSKRE